MFRRGIAVLRRVWSEQQVDRIVIVSTITMRSNTCCFMRRASQSPANAPTMTSGTNTASISRVWVSKGPIPARNGTLATWTIAKNHADVPRNTCTGVRLARKCIDMTGPAAFATIVVKSASPP